MPGPDEALLRRLARLLDPIFHVYFRSEVRGLERVPDGSTLLICNHDGGILPLDGVALGIGWHHHFNFQRPLRILMHSVLFDHFGRGLASLLHRIGAVSPSPTNLEQLLDDGQTVLIYPGAAHECFRPYRQRRTIDLAGRTGFVARAIRHGIPITPVVSVGAHEMLFILARGAPIARALGIARRFHADAWPIALGLPWGLWHGPMIPYLPLPSKMTLEVLDPIPTDRALGRRLTPADAADPAVVCHLFGRVLDAMNTALARLYAERRWPVLG